MRPRTFSVVVNWNGGERNLVCLRSLVAQGLAPAEIVFVDNASTDGSRERVAEAFPGLTVLRNERNEGYGDATNRGIAHALAHGAEFVFLANNDLRLPDGALAELAAALERAPGVGIVGPRIVYEKDPGTIWAAGGRMTFRQNLSTMIGHRAPDGPRYRRTLDVDYVPGCAMLVRRAVFERVGLLEGDYFAYHEDVELCLEARAAGFGVRVVGETLAYHDAHGTTGGGYNPRRKYMMGLNTVRFLKKHGTPWRWGSFLVFDVLSLPAAWLVRAPRGEGGAVLAKARGMLDGFRGRRVTSRDAEAVAGKPSR
jgi:GT2 family glycosyltransferase